LLTIGADGTVSYDRSNFAFLGAGQSLSYNIAFDVKSGPDTVHLALTFTVNGGNEAPTISIGPGDSAAATITDDTHATGTDLVAHLARCRSKTRMSRMRIRLRSP
jgi:VCBS repeat-containing protein